MNPHTCIFGSNASAKHCCRCRTQQKRLAACAAPGHLKGHTRSQQAHRKDSGRHWLQSSFCSCCSIMQHPAHQPQVQIVQVLYVTPPGCTQSGAAVASPDQEVCWLARRATSIQQATFRTKPITDPTNQPPLTQHNVLTAAASHTCTTSQFKRPCCSVTLCISRVINAGHAMHRTGLDITPDCML